MLVLVNEPDPKEPETPVPPPPDDEQELVFVEAQEIVVAPL